MEINIVQLGDIYVNGPLTQNFGIRNIIPHPNYRRNINYHDIALIELDKTVKFSRYIKPACLPILSAEPKKLIVCGFGKQDFREVSGIDYLQKVELVQYSNEVCNDKYRNLDGFPRGVIKEYQICYGAGTRYKYRDTCQGDSGGPLQSKDIEVSAARIYGIVSSGIRCGIPGTPGIYTRVANYVPWIESIVWK